MRPIAHPIECSPVKAALRSGCICALLVAGLILVLLASPIPLLLTIMDIYVEQWLAPISITACAGAAFVAAANAWREVARRQQGNDETTRTVTLAANKLRV